MSGSQFVPGNLVTLARAGTGEVIAEPFARRADPAYSPRRVADDQGIGRNVFGYDRPGSDHRVSPYVVPANDGRVGPDCRPPANPRGGELVFPLNMGAGGKDVGKDARRAAEHVVFKGDALVNRDVILDFAAVADGDVGADSTALPDDAVIADAAVSHDLREMPDARPGADCHVVADYHAVGESHLFSPSGIEVPHQPENVKDRHRHQTVSADEVHLLAPSLAAQIKPQRHRDDAEEAHYYDFGSHEARLSQRLGKRQQTPADTAAVTSGTINVGGA